VLLALAGKDLDIANWQIAGSYHLSFMIIVYNGFHTLITPIWKEWDLSSWSKYISVLYPAIACLSLEVLDPFVWLRLKPDKIEAVNENLFIFH